MPEGGGHMPNPYEYNYKYKVQLPEQPSFQDVTSLAWLGAESWPVKWPQSYEAAG